MGNELCGRRGVFLDPGTPQWQIGPEGYAAEGLWPEIAGRVCGEIGRLAALQGRPVVGSVQILGDADPVDYSLPPEYREAIHKFMGYARSRGLYTSSIRTAVSSIPKHDHYHFREDPPATGGARTSIPQLTTPSSCPVQRHHPSPLSRLPAMLAGDRRQPRLGCTCQFSLELEAGTPRCHAELRSVRTTPHWLT